MAADEPDALALENSSSRLDNAYGLLVRGLNEKTRSRLEAAQKAWAGYRDAECSYQVPSSPKACLIAMNMARAAAFEDTARLGRTKNQFGNTERKRGKLDQLGQFAGTYRYEAILAEPGVTEALVGLAGKEAAEQIQSNLQVRSPVAMIDRDLVLRGNAPHEGGENEAMVMINLLDGSVRAALLHQEKLTLFARDHEYRYIPRELREFVRRSAALNDVFAGVAYEGDTPPNGVQWVK